MIIEAIKSLLFEAQVKCVELNFFDWLAWKVWELRTAISGTLWVKFLIVFCFGIIPLWIIMKLVE